MKRMNQLQNVGTQLLHQKEMKIQISNLKGHVCIKILVYLGTYH